MVIDLSDIFLRELDIILEFISTKGLDNRTSFRPPAATISNTMLKKQQN